MRKKIPLQAIAKIECPEYTIDRVDGIIFYPITRDVFSVNGKQIGCQGKLSEKGVLIYYDPTNQLVKSTAYIDINFIKQKYRPMSDSKKCPFHFEDDIELVNVGALAEFPDGKDNYCCPKCKRIWIDVDTGEWTTRVANVMMVKELVEGEQYADIVKVI